MTPAGPDPLGKRALFWAPAARVEDQVRPGDEESEDIGKYALFSRFSDEPEIQRLPTGRGPMAGAVRGLLSPVEVQCSSCGVSSQVDMVGYLALHVPFFLWRPGRGYTRFMTCPSCRRRTWVSASWTPWSTR